MIDNSGIRIKYRSEFGPESLPESGFEKFFSWRKSGKLGFLDLPFDESLHHLSTDLGKDITVEYSDLIIIGIGGSALGLRALHSACPGSERIHLHIVDTPDADVINKIKKYTIPSRCIIVVITKSGGTTETLACFLDLFSWMKTSLEEEEICRRIIAVTDSSDGDLRRLAEKTGLRSLPVPGNVGGRYSVLSPVGVFPAFCLGIDTSALLEGAAAVVRDFDNKGRESLASKIASGFFTHFGTHRTHVFFSYRNQLFNTALWFSQLWAESLGKKLDLSGEEVRTGQTPLACRGPADQHSLFQLFIEGPADKFFTFITVPHESKPLPGGFDDYPSMAFLEGKTLNELMLTEAEATATALERRGLPVVRFELADLSEITMGNFFMLMEIVTVLVGFSLGINPLDQPGVEISKILTYQALGRPGYNRN